MGTYKTRHLTSDRTIPLVIEPANPNITREGFADLLQGRNDEFKRLLLEQGALLFRNFPVADAKDFASVIRHLGIGSFLDYKGGDSPRVKIAEGVFTSTEAPPWLQIPLHNELSYSSHYPSHILFYCDIEPAERGQTPIADARKVFRAIDPRIREEFMEKGLSYSSSYHSGSGLIPAIVGKGHRSWQEVFETSDRKEVERVCEEKGLKFKWNKGGWLSFSHSRPSTHIHPRTAEEVWFNQAHIFKLTPKFLGWWRFVATQLIYFRKHTVFHDVCFGDGTPIPQSSLYHIMDKLEENSIYFPWKKGDVLVLDNILAMHGRAPFNGKRRILTSMTSAP